MRRELGVLQAAINFAHRNDRLTRFVAVAMTDPAGKRKLAKDRSIGRIVGLVYATRPCLPWGSRQDNLVVKKEEEMIRPQYRNEFEKDGLEKVRDNVLHHPYKISDQQEQARIWIEEKEGAQHRAYENRVEIAAWLAVVFAFIAAFFGLLAYFR
jgi:hypothetical protein